MRPGKNRMWMCRCELFAHVCQVDTLIQKPLNNKNIWTRLSPCFCSSSFDWNASFRALFGFFPAEKLLGSNNTQIPDKVYPWWCKENVRVKLKVFGLFSLLDSYLFRTLYGLILCCCKERVFERTQLLLCFNFLPIRIVLCTDPMFFFWRHKKDKVHTFMVTHWIVWSEDNVFLSLTVKQLDHTSVSGLSDS